MSSTTHATLVSSDRGWRGARWLALGHFRWRSELTMYNQARLRKRPACRRALAWHGERRRAQYGNPVVEQWNVATDCLVSGGFPRR